MEYATRLSVAVAAALMPDARQGYGLPIGGVLATDPVVVPYAVGMDIACRMRLSVTALPCSCLVDGIDRLKDALLRETDFGVGSSFGKNRCHHPVMGAGWDVNPVTRAGKDKAWSQRGTSGSGNHFAEFGLLTLPADDLGLTAGTDVGFLTHGWSRGIGADVASHYSRLAMRMPPELPKAMRELAWLPLDTEEGETYWGAMALMEDYAAANHALVHKHVLAALGVDPILSIENHQHFSLKARSRIKVATRSARRCAECETQRQGNPPDQSLAPRWCEVATKQTAYRRPSPKGRALLPPCGVPRCRHILDMPPPRSVPDGKIAAPSCYPYS